MNKYANLITNTLIFAIGTFSSKLMVFLLMPLYTRVLTTADYGVMDLVVNTSNLLLPLVIVGINDAVIRFGMDKSVRRSDVFSIGLFTTLIGFGVFLCFYPLMARVSFTDQYTWLIYLYILAAAFHAICAQFVRSIGLVRLFAFEGVFNTLSVITGNILMLVVLRWGVTGYVMSVIAANLISSLFLIWAARLWRYVRFRGISRETWRSMLVYSLPLIPATMMWFITNVSDRFFVTYFLGEAANGLYSVAYKIPTVISLISTIFMQAWQLSAISENEDDKKELFYSDVFKSYQSVVFLAASGILLLLRPITALLVSPAFYEAWRFSPLLIMSVVFSCFSNFYSSFYMAAKKNTMAMVTTCMGALTNVLLNYHLIPIWGAQGAAFATFASYLLMFTVRAIDTRRLVKLDIAPLRLLCNAVLLMTQAILLIKEPAWVIWGQLGLTLLILLVNLKPLLSIAVRLLRGIQRRFSKGGTN